MEDMIDGWENREQADVVLKVRENQIQQLYRQSWIGLTGVFLVMLSVTVVLWPVVATWKLAVWAGISILLTLVRAAIAVAFQRRLPSGIGLYQWARLHVAGTTASGLLWAMASIFLWPEHFPVHQMVLPLCIVSLSAVAVATYCTWTPSYLSFLILSTVPLAVRLLSEGGLAHTVLGVLAFIFIAILVQTGREMHAASLRALVVGLRNEALSLFVSEEKKTVEVLNGQLQLEIAERTRSQEDLRLQNQELEQALSNVKQLSGMLPICASCKSIRNDDGYWEQIDAYVRDHSEVEFSHGLCPQCVAALYPDYHAKIAKNQPEPFTKRPAMTESP